MIVFILSVLLLAWVSFTIGFCLIGTQLSLAKRIKKQLWNGRIDKLGKPPFSLFLRAYAEKNYIKTFGMVLICNIPGHIAMFLFGLIKIGVVMMLVQPFLQGAVVGMGDDKTRLWGVLTAIFEVSGFIVSCCLGFFARLDFWWIPAVFLLLNAVIESGGVLVGVTGVPGKKAVEHKEYIK